MTLGGRANRSDLITQLLCIAFVGAVGCSGDDDTTKPQKTTDEMKMETKVDIPAEDPNNPSDWITMGYSPASTYWNVNEKQITKENAAALEVAYLVDMGGNVYGAPLMVGDKLYVNSQKEVRALKADTGDQIWTASPGGTSGSMTYSDGTLYVNTTGSKLVALSATDGMMTWTATYNDQAADGTSSPLVAGDVVIVGGSNGGIELGGGMFRGFLSAVDRKTGELKWTTFTTPDGSKGASIWSSPSADIEAGFAYAGTGNNYGPPASDASDSIIQFDLASGEIKYKAQVRKEDAFSLGGNSGPDYDFGANPTLYETMVNGAMTQLATAGDKGGVVHSIRRDTGEVVWTRELGMGFADGSSGVFTNGAWTGKIFVVAMNESGPATLYGLDGATGDIVWMRALAGQVWGRTAVANGVGFVGTGTNLEVFDVDTGAPIKSFPSSGGTVAGTITVGHGRVAFGEGLTWSNGVAGTKVTVLSLPKKK